MKKIEKLELVTISEISIQPKGTYYDTNEIPFHQERDIEVTTSYNRLPNNEEIMDKINEIIDYINKEK